MSDKVSRSYSGKRIYLHMDIAISGENILRV